MPLAPVSPNVNHVSVAVFLGFHVAVLLGSPVRLLDGLGFAVGRDVLFLDLLDSDVVSDLAVLGLAVLLERRWLTYRPPSLLARVAIGVAVLLCVVQIRPN